MMSENVCENLFQWWCFHRVFSVFFRVWPVPLRYIGWENGLWPGRRQAIISTNAGILLIGPLGSKFSVILIEIHTFSFKKMHLKMSSGKFRPFCLGLHVLKYGYIWLYFNRTTRCITHPCPKLNGGLAKMPFRLGHGCIVTSHRTLLYEITYPCHDIKLTDPVGEDCSKDFLHAVILQLCEC